jgi:hypothetical protein
MSLLTELGDWTFCQHRIPLARRFTEGLKKAQCQKPLQRFFNSEQQERLATVGLVGRHGKPLKRLID